MTVTVTVRVGRCAGDRGGVEPGTVSLGGLPRIEQTACLHSTSWPEATRQRRATRRRTARPEPFPPFGATKIAPCRRGPTRFRHRPPATNRILSRWSRQRRPRRPTSRQPIRRSSCHASCNRLTPCPTPTATTQPRRTRPADATGRPSGRTTNATAPDSEWAATRQRRSAADWAHPGRERGASRPVEPKPDSPSDPLGLSPRRRSPPRHLRSNARSRRPPRLRRLLFNVGSHRSLRRLRPRREPEPPRQRTTVPPAPAAAPTGPPTGAIGGVVVPGGPSDPSGRTARRASRGGVASPRKRGAAGRPTSGPVRTHRDPAPDNGGTGAPDGGPSPTRSPRHPRRAARRSVERLQGRRGVQPRRLRDRHRRWCVAVERGLLHRHDRQHRARAWSRPAGESSSSRAARSSTTPGSVACSSPSAHRLGRARGHAVQPITDLVGGVRLTVLEEEVVEKTTSPMRRFATRRDDPAAQRQ